MSSSAAELQSWQGEVDRLVADSLTLATFADLLDHLPSIDPLTVHRSLERQFPGGGHTARLMSGGSQESAVSQLPIPHPLNFDWRYTAETNNDFVRRLATETEVGDAIGYFGAPSTWRVAQESLPDRRHVLFDRDAARHGSATCEAYAVEIGREAPPSIPLAAAIVDPPWYPEHHDAFLAAAASLLRAEGIVYASFPPPLTRPGVLAERANILVNCVRSGLAVLGESLLVLRYETPPFERAAFAAAGLAAVPHAWRRGDLLTLRKVAAGQTSVEMALVDEGWRFVTIDEIPLAVRSAVARDRARALFAPAIAGATLPTVSRRHPARADAALWSSRNRIYGSNEPELLTAVVVGLAEGSDPTALAADSGVEEEKMVTIANEIKDLVRLERKEHGLD